MEKPTLVILAAGMGSRYGGLKQIDTVGNNGESIIDFSIYDAKEAGFEKVVLIIRKEHEEAFRKCLTDKVSKHMEVEFAYQDMYDIPGGIKVPEGREKPWGTTHALLACRNIVKGPFAICNADDFYGKDAYRVIYNYLKNEISDDNYGMVGYLCNNTLTDNGTVTRGVCENTDGYLSKIVEVQKIARKDGKPVYEDNGEWKELDPNTLVSMNFWGFTPKIFEECEVLFKDFIGEAVKENPMKCEHVIPTAIGTLVKENKCKVKMLSSKDEWFGVTYKEDKPSVVAKIQKMKDDGIYPFDLWK
ncbi:MAG: sugar phosphate nucleotidyltransferase [Firmicutes bacterium]|nr:sugar phosphate nucleotidyltransferase [Bacillota bacterium]MDY4973351.1 sugar phosphate nucleotidyltransferase [Erysipelotrichaceae bacterium]MDY5996937.1 sugar phosphate nucleotidyltransferase [Erysipelotrichaceae bacterium]